MSSLPGDPEGLDWGSLMPGIYVWGKNRERLIFKKITKEILNVYAFVVIYSDASVSAGPSEDVDNSMPEINMLITLQEGGSCAGNYFQNPRQLDIDFVLDLGML